MDGIFSVWRYTYGADVHMVRKGENAFIEARVKGIRKAGNSLGGIAAGAFHSESEIRGRANRFEIGPVTVFFGVPRARSIYLVAPTTPA